MKSLQLNFDGNGIHLVPMYRDLSCELFIARSCRRSANENTTFENELMLRVI